MKKLAILILLSFPVFAFTQQTAKIMTYNLLNFQSTDTSRNVYFRTVMNAVKPDILVTQENTSQQGVNIFLNQIMKPVNSNYQSGVFIDGTDTDNAIFYDSTKFKFISNKVIATNLRNINEFKFFHKLTGDTLRIFSCHLKASSGVTNENARAAEVDSLRKYTNNLPTGTSFIAGGDFNIYGSSEPAYQKLLQTGFGDGNLNDMLSMSGIWNSSSYKPYHTQSTRTRSFGDGSTGGLDDRFDMILYSNSIKNNGKVSYVSGSLTAYGNDGNHYNDSINKIPNTAVSQTIADALHYGSDHLPVYAVFSFTPSDTYLNVKAAPEGFYNLSNLKLNIRDTIKLILRKNVSPYEISDSSIAVIDSVSFLGSFKFSKTYTGNYYVILKGRNIIETWSKSEGESINAGSTYNYDFTNLQSSAYGNNLVLKGLKYCLYSGDITQDGIIDAADLSATENDASNSVSGYVKTDLTGDYYVDAEDLSIAENNASNSVTLLMP